MGFIGWKKYGVYRQGKIMGFICKFKHPTNKQQSKLIRKVGHYQKKQHKMK